MNLRNKLKKFFTLSRQHEAGFTLIELIVVIVILGILGGVGTVAYSGYMKKANMAADQTLVSDVMKALELGYYSNLDTPVSGYVVLSTNGKPACSNPEIEKYLQASFGDDLNGLALQYDGWVINSALLNAALWSDAAAVGNSAYLTYSSVPELLDNVQTVTSAAAGLLGSVTKSEQEYINSLRAALGEDYLEDAYIAGIVDRTGTEGNYVYSFKEGTYTEENGTIELNDELHNQLSNLMVLSVADELKNADTETMTMELMLCAIDPEVTVPDGYTAAAGMAATYALYKSVALENGLTDEFNAMNDELAKATSLQDAKNALAEFYDTNWELVDSYVSTDTENLNESYVTDANAIISIMNGVSAVSGNYNDAESLANSGLYTSEAIASDLNNYVAVVAFAGNLSGLTNEQKAELLRLTDGILISISESGVVACYSIAA